MSSIYKNLGSVVFWLTATVVTVFLSSKIVTDPESVLWFIGGIVLIGILYQKPHWGIYISLFLPLIGELYRLPFGPESGVLISDVFLGLFIGIWFLKKFLQKKTLPTEKIHSLTQHKKFLITWSIFVGLAALSLLQALLFLPLKEVVNSSLYLIRFIEYSLLFVIIFDYGKGGNGLQATSAKIKNLLITLTASSLLIALGGFVQLIVYPNLTKLEEYGWDPHINRLVSTWLDPNFVGGFFAFVISLLLGLLLYSKKWKHQISLIIIVGILGAALFLTYSRSAYLALAVAVIILGLLKSRKLLIILTCLFFLGINFSPRAQERVNDLVHSMSSIIFSTAENPDPTARLRLKSWEQTWSIIAKRPLLGSGYNTLRYVNYQEGFVENTGIHSASGSDSSLLTILATTGILGFLPFIYLYWQILANSFKAWRKKKGEDLEKAISLGLLGGTFALLIHSFFVNSLLFPQIMIFFWVVVGIQARIQKSSANPSASDI